MFGKKKKQPPKTFEDEFMAVQSDLIALCMEAIDGKTDLVYAYASIEEKSQMFNAFFVADGEVKTINQFLTCFDYSRGSAVAGNTAATAICRTGYTVDCHLPNLPLCVEQKGQEIRR